MRFIVLIVAMLMAVSVSAGNNRAMRKQLESSLQVSGTIIVRPDGTVQSHTIDPKAPLGEPLTKFVDATVRKWRFEPVLVDGKPATVQVPMHLRLVAKPAEEEGKLDVVIASSYFGSSDEEATTDKPKGVKLTPPKYPENAQHMGGKGTAYLIVEIGPDGKVTNVGVEQVNLRTIGPENVMNQMRKEFGDAAVRAARRWTFAPPTTGETADDGRWFVRIPVDYDLRGPGQKPKQAGQWDTYIPGPRSTDLPWAQEKLRTAGAPDALPGDGVYPLQQGVKLLTPPAT